MKAHVIATLIIIPALFGGCCPCCSIRNAANADKMLLKKSPLPRNADAVMRAASHIIMLNSAQSVM